MYKIKNNKINYVYIKIKKKIIREFDTLIEFNFDIFNVIYKNIFMRTIWKGKRSVNFIKDN